MSRGITYLLTGLPGAGKSTIARLAARKMGWEWLDGDIVRNSPLSAGEGFDFEDRQRHLLRIAYVCRLLNRNGVSVTERIKERLRSLRHFGYGRSR